MKTAEGVNFNPTGVIDLIKAKFNTELKHFYTSNFCELCYACLLLQ
jgi:hypothetical protein